MAFVYVLSRKRRFRCERCGELFYSHTLGSRVFLGLWIVFWVSLVFAVFSLVTSLGRH